MRLVSFSVGGARSYGAVVGEGIVDLGARLPYQSLAALIREEGAAAARAVLEGAAPDVPLAQARLEKPLETFGKCFCVGVNYAERNAEYKDGSEAPKYPSLFIRFPESLVGPEEALVRPPESPQLDYEGEIVLVVGRRGRRIQAKDWREHVFGWTIGNEGTIRDWVRHGKFNVTPGKNWSGSGSLGPAIVTPEDMPAEPWRVVTRVNGEERQNDTTDRMMFPFGTILAYVSTFCTLEPGDIIFTGTPNGAGARFEPPRYLVPGDSVEVEVPGLGVLRNGVRDE